MGMKLILIFCILEHFSRKLALVLLQEPNHYLSTSFFTCWNIWTLFRSSAKMDDHPVA